MSDNNQSSSSQGSGSQQPAENSSNDFIAALQNGFEPTMRLVREGAGETLDSILGKWKE